MDLETYYKSIEALKGDIEKDFYKKISPSIQQISDAVRNSNVVHQEILEKMLLQSQNEIKDKIHEFEIKLIAIEKGLWGKRHLYALYIIVIISILALVIK